MAFLPTSIPSKINEIDGENLLNIPVPLVSIGYRVCESLPFWRGIRSSFVF